MDTKITFSIVLFNNNIDILRVAINSCLRTNLNIKLYLIDNSPTNELNKLVKDFRIEYTHNPSNPGFGSSHNVAIQKAIDLGSKFHFIVNPDISFEDDLIRQMVGYAENDCRIGMMMPQILNLDGTLQNLPKLLPSPVSILIRKFKKPEIIYNNFINKYELRAVPKDKIYNTPILSGCFTLLNLDAIQEVGVFDDNYFMYFEDWDLSRRMHKKYKTIYYPLVSVYHGYESGANKSFKLFKIYIQSAFTYFNKWGWFIDKERRQINEKTLSQFD
jgi:GT2 family glycosyltransferase